MIVHARGLRRTFPGLTRPVLDGVDLTLGSGERVAIVGPSGSGKSTLLAILGLLDRPDAGTYQLSGVDALRLSPDAAAAERNRRIGFVFQDHHLLPQCPALHNVLVPVLAASWWADATAVERAKGLLDALGLADRQDHLPSQLSTGQRQRVALARALVLRPALVLADEPTGSLDRASADELVALLLAEVREAALVVVTHDPAVAAAMDRVLVLKDGRLEPA